MLEVTPQARGAFTWKHGVFEVTCRPDAFAKLEKFAQRIGLKLEDLLEAKQKLDEQADELPPVTVTVRDETQAAFEGTQKEVKSAQDLTTLVSSTATGKLLTWRSDRFAVVDLDWHEADPPPANQLVAVVGTVNPKPAAWWFSRSNGLHLLYGDAENLDGILWASAAAIDCAQKFPSAEKVEVIRKTRRAGNPVPSVQDVGTALAAWRSVVSGELDGVDDWLEEHGMQMGGRYDHSKCLIDPDDKSTNPSVQVMENGIHCFRCGFKGWGSILATDETTGMVWEAARNWCWFAQIGKILEDQYGGRVTTKVLRDAYKCLLSILHRPDDPRVNLAMLDTQVYRTSGGNWVGKDLKLITQQTMKDTYHKTFPGPMRFDENNERLPDDVETKANYLGSPPLTGIPDLLFVRGARMYGQHLDYPDGTHTYRVNGGSRSRYPFQYRSDRPTESELKGMVDSYFPAIDFKYLLLCLAARGYAESLPGMPPIILAFGNSGSGKTTTPMIAAAMCDESPSFVPNIEDEGRWSEQFGEKSRESSFVILDEVFKMQKQAVVRERLIALRREFSYRALYVGPVTRCLDNLVICTGITIPDELLESEQLGRRAVAMHLQQRELTWHKKNCGVLLNRWRDDQERAVLADYVVSHVIDRFFSEPRDFVTDIAAEIEVPTLRDYAASGEGINFKKLLWRFVQLLAEAPETDKGKGWREIRRGQTTELAEIWEQLNDGHGPNEYWRSEKISEKPLGQVLNLPYSVYLDSDGSGQRAYIRFLDRKETRGSGSYKTTKEIWEDAQRNRD